MIYLDTSFLTPLFREEATSLQVEEFFSSQETGTLAVSKLTSLEFASLVSRDVRMKILTTAQGLRLTSAFEEIIFSSMEVVVPGAKDFDLAQEYVIDFATQLRGPDALHLAIVHNHKMDFIATLDEGMLFAAKKLNISARRIIA